MKDDEMDRAHVTYGQGKGGTEIHTVIPRLAKIIRSGITFVSRNVVSRCYVSNLNNPFGLVGLPYVMWSAHFFVTHIQTE